MTHDQTVEAPDGTSIAWSRHGTVHSDRTPVVLVHGITESAASWDPVVELLTGGDVPREVITLDLRGHGESGHADSYDLASMAGDVIAVIAAASPPGSAGPVQLVGHSLGGAVVSAVGAMTPVAGVVDVDQSLRLSSFKEQLMAAEGLLRDPDTYRVVVDMMFDSMRGELLSPAESQRVDGLRRADQEVVLGVWELLLTADETDVAGTVDAMLVPYRERPTPYLALFGLDPGDDYADWLTARVPGAVVEHWADHGHYPHLVDPQRFVARLEQFWAG